MPKPEGQINEESLSLAYEFVFYSYEWMLRRLEAVEDRIQRLLIFAATVTVGFPIVVVSLRGGDNPNLVNEGWGLFAILALAFFIIFMIVCIVARQKGKIGFPNVGKLPEEWLYKSKGDFQRMVIRTGGKDHTRNSNLVNLKACLVDVAFVLFFVEGIFWGLWAYGILSS